MLASRSFAIDAVSGFIRIGPDLGTGSEERRLHPVVRSLGPALETAFGIEHEALFPDEIRALVEALRAGPLGAEAELRRAGRALERA